MVWRQSSRDTITHMSESSRSRESSTLCPARVASCARATLTGAPVSLVPATIRSTAISTLKPHRINCCSGRWMRPAIFSTTARSLASALLPRENDQTEMNQAKEVAMQTVRTTLLLLCVLLFTAHLTLAQDKPETETRVTMRNLPPAVQQTVREQRKGAVLLGLAKEVEN